MKRYIFSEVRRQFGTGEVKDVIISYPYSKKFMTESTYDEIVENGKYIPITKKNFKAFVGTAFEQPIKECLEKGMSVALTYVEDYKQFLPFFHNVEQNSWYDFGEITRYSFGEEENPNIKVDRNR